MNVNSSALARRQELDLHSSMASLNIRDDNERNNTSNRSQVPKEVLCKLKGRQISSSELKRKRRCQLKPTKLNRSLFAKHSEYVNKLMYSQSSKLDTIYEETVEFKNDDDEHCSCVKARVIKLNIRMKPLKMRIKKSDHSKVRLERKISMDEFISKFHDLSGTKLTNGRVDGTDSVMDVTTSIPRVISSHKSAFFSNC